MFFDVQILQTGPQGWQNGITLDTSSLVFFLSMLFFLSMIGFTMNSKEIGKHRLPPAGYWFLIALDAHGPSKVSDLVALEVFSLHAIHEGARAALELGLCTKAGTTWALPSENRHSTTNYTAENRQNDENRHSENRQNDEFSESDSRAFKAFVSKPLKDKDLKTTQAVFNPSNKEAELIGNTKNEQNINDDNDKKGENYGVSIFYEYGQNVLELDADTCRRLWALGQGQRGRWWQVIDCYRWNHVESAGEPIKNVLAWANRTLQNGVNKQTPQAFTFAYWAEDRAWVQRAKENRARLDAEKARDDALRAEARANLSPDELAARALARALWLAESAAHPAPGVYAAAAEHAAHRAWLKDWTAREPRT